MTAARGRQPSRARPSRNRAGASAARAHAARPDLTATPPAGPLVVALECRGWRSLLFKTLVLELRRTRCGDQRETRSSDSSARRRATPGPPRATTRTFSNAVILQKRRVRWKVPPMPTWLKRWEPVRVISVPRKQMGPAARSGPLGRRAPVPDLPTGTATFHFTDIAGSTRRWEQNPAGDAAGARLTRRPLSRGHRGPPRPRLHNGRRRLQRRLSRPGRRYRRAMAAHRGPAAEGPQIRRKRRRGRSPPIPARRARCCVARR